MSDPKTWGLGLRYEDWLERNPYGPGKRTGDPMTLEEYDRKQASLHAWRQLPLAIQRATGTMRAFNGVLIAADWGVKDGAAVALVSEDGESWRLVDELSDADRGGAVAH